MLSYSTATAMIPGVAQGFTIQYGFQTSPSTTLGANDRATEVVLALVIDMDTVVMGRAITDTVQDMGEASITVVAAGSMIEVVIIDKMVIMREAAVEEAIEVVVAVTMVEEVGTSLQRVDAFSEML